MAVRERFYAPWSTRLKVTTGVFGLVLIAVAVAVAGWGSAMVAGPLVAMAAFAIRGYSVMDGKVLIHRPGWSTKFDLANLKSAEVNPRAMRGSVRTMGIGGFFGYIGHFENDVLGPYKAYATNGLNTVVLVFSEETIVVTPDDPQAFVEAVRAASSALSTAAEASAEE